MSAVISRFVVMTVGTLYPAYRSYKAVRTKDVREYVKWMMYWITFAVYLTLEMFTDTFLSFLVPFYYELKILFVMWLISPYTKGASLLYRKFIHPTLTRHENDIDEYLDRAKSNSYTTLLKLGNQGIVYARDVVATAAVKGVSHIHKSYSMSDVSNTEGELQRLPVEGRRRGVEIQEIEEEAEDATDEAGEKVWHGYYNERGQLVEEEFEELGEEGVDPPPRRSTRRRKEPPRDGYATLPRPSSRNRRAKNS